MVTIKKGFTLIEVLVVMAIVLLLSSISYGEISNYKKLSNRIDVDNFNSSILTMFNFARIYCKYKECIGKVVFSPKEDKISFYEGQFLKESLQLPKGFHLKENNMQNNNYSINIVQDGGIKTAGSLLYEDRRGETHIISIGVGAFYVEIKK